ncbi:M6 family metalloprotease domain-containing protein [bacterium]|nr:M6 family metalloprotease domain-containing protein [bacterium]
MPSLTARHHSANYPATPQIENNAWFGSRGVWQIARPFLVVLLFVAAGHLAAMEPPDPGELQGYAADGSLAVRMEFARSLGNHLVDPALARRHAEVLQAAARGEEVPRSQLPYPTGLPASGSPRIFVLPIEFPEYPAHNDVSVIEHKLFGTGEADEKPLESLTEYYKRSSYGALNIQGDVLPWYQAAHPRTWYGPGVLIKEALQHWDPTHDFSVYDNDGNGTIDYFMVCWTGPDDGWGNLWWAWCDMSASEFAGDSFTVDGKKLGVFSWQWEGRPLGSEFQAEVVIHETGHALGLPDLYDYDESVGPVGGVGGLDMMDANWGDHNAFSKWMLGWLTPTVISTSESIISKSLRPSSEYPDAIMIMPGASGASPFTEYFLIQNRSRRTEDTNDFTYPNDGLVVWHLDAELNGTGDGFLFDNSYTSRKLIRLMEADGLEEIVAGGGVDEDDYYTSSRYFSSLSTPNSRAYSGSVSGVGLLNIYRITRVFTLPSTFQATYAITSEGLLSIGEAVDKTDVTWKYTTAAPWVGVVMAADYGNDAARSAPIADGETTSFSTIVDGPGSVQFAWKVSSEEGGDFLAFEIDGVEQEAISGEQDWEGRSFLFGENGHTLTWKYRKNASVSSGQDRGWVDHVELGLVSLGEALDCPALEWTSDTSPVWYGQSQDSFYGGSAARCGATADSQMSRMSCTVTGPGTMTFLWKSSCDASDELRFRMDILLPISISGETDWQQRTITIPSGTHTCRWDYVKDASGTAGADAGWVDKVTYQMNDLGDAVENTFLPWTTSGEGGAWTSQTGISAVDGDAAEAPTPSGVDMPALLETWIYGPGTLTYRWKESTVGNAGDLTLLLDDDFKDYADNTADWVDKALAIPSGLHKVTWRYLLYFSGTDQAWVDNVQFTPSGIDLDEALDCQAVSWETPDTIGWTGITDTSAFGFDSARTGSIGHNGLSYLQGRIHGPAMVSFNWKVSSEENKDELEFLADGYGRFHISGDVDWERRYYHLVEGQHDVGWYYWKDASGSAGEDAGWVDRVSVDPDPSLGEVLDTTGLAWTSGGSNPWYGQTLITQDGEDAAQSGDVYDGQTSFVSTILDGPGTLTYQWSVSSQAGGDWLSFLVDDVLQDQISGVVDWHEGSANIQPGQHEVKWSYGKNSMFSDYDDAGWLDQIVFTPGPVPTPTPVPTATPVVSLADALDCYRLDFQVISSNPWYGEYDVSYDGADAAQSYPITHSQTSAFFTTITGPDTLEFQWKVSCQPTSDYLALYLDGSEVTRITGETNWALYSLPIDAGDHQVVWSYKKDSSVSQGSDAGWVDQVKLLSVKPGNAWVFQ